MPGELSRRLVNSRMSDSSSAPLQGNRGIGPERDADVAKGNYKIVCKLFNIESADYKKFLNFLRKHDCQLPFKEFRQ